VDWALPDEPVLESLRAVNDSFGAPYPETKLRDTLANAHRYGRGAYGNDLLPDHVATVVDNPASVAGSKASGIYVPPFICVSDLLAKEIPKVPSILGGDLYPNLWRQGTNAELHGPEGKGKTQAAIWLAVVLAAKTHWFGIPGPEKALRVAMVATELDEELLQLRIGMALKLLAMDDDSTAEVASRIFVIPSNVWMPSGSTSATIDRFRAEMDALCGRLAEVRADVGIFDPLLTFWSEKLNYGPLVDYALRIPHVLPGFSPIWIQHNRKTSAEQQSGSSEALSNSIGDGDWTRRGLRTAFQLAPYGRSETVRELIVTKSNHSQAPPPIYLQHDPDYGGLLRVCPKPDSMVEAAEGNRVRLLDLIRSRPGLTVKEAIGELDLSEKQVRNGLAHLEQSGSIHHRPLSSPRTRGPAPHGYWPGIGDEEF
jgi:hypothetical protein